MSVRRYGGPRVQILRAGRDRDKCNLFRGWTRLRLCSACFNSAEGSSTFTIAPAQIARGGAGKVETDLLVDKGGIPQNATTTVAKLASATTENKKNRTNAYGQSIEESDRMKLLESAIQREKRNWACMLVRATTFCMSYRVRQPDPLSHHSPSLYRIYRVNVLGLVLRSPECAETLVELDAPRLSWTPHIRQPWK